MRKNFYRSDFLFTEGSFLIGMGSILGIFTPYYTFNSSASSTEVDKKAIESDFGVAGNDIFAAMEGEL